MTKLFINTGRDGYTTKQCGDTMTVGELIAYLEQFEEDTPVYLKNDNGYTYGYITESRLEEAWGDDDEDGEGY